MRPSKTLENTTLSVTYCRVQLICMKVQAHRKFFRTTNGIKSGAHTFDKRRFVMTFLTNLGVKEVLCSFRLVLEVKMGNEIPESSTT